MNIQEELLNGLRELRSEFDKIKVIVEYNDGLKINVDAIVNSVNIQDSQSPVPIYLNTATFNILKQDIIDEGGYIKNFKYITWDRIQYSVIQRPLSSWQQVIVLEGKIF